MKPVKHLLAYLLGFTLLIVIFLGAAYLALPLPRAASARHLSVQSDWHNSWHFGTGNYSMYAEPIGGGPCVKTVLGRYISIGPVTVIR